MYACVGDFCEQFIIFGSWCLVFIKHLCVTGNIVLSVCAGNWVLDKGVDFFLPGGILGPCLGIEKKP